MQKKYILCWQHTMQNSTKLEFFNTFKNDYTQSSCLGLINEQSERKKQVKLRIDNHKLRIETSRYDEISRVIDFALFVHLTKLKVNLTFVYIAINTLF